MVNAVDGCIFRSSIVNTVRVAVKSRFKCLELCKVTTWLKFGERIVIRSGGGQYFWCVVLWATTTTTIVVLSLVVVVLVGGCWAVVGGGCSGEWCARPSPLLYWCVIVTFLRSCHCPLLVADAVASPHSCCHPDCCCCCQCTYKVSILWRVIAVASVVCY